MNVIFRILLSRNVSSLGRSFIEKSFANAQARMLNISGAWQTNVMVRLGDNNDEASVIEKRTPDLLTSYLIGPPFVF